MFGPMAANAFPNGGAQVIETLTEALRAHRPQMAACGVRRVTIVLPHHRRGERRGKARARACAGRAQGVD